MDKPGFRRELQSLINKHSMENGSNTPDFLLADYLVKCLEAFDAAAAQRERWYGRADRPGRTDETPLDPRQ